MKLIVSLMKLRQKGIDVVIGLGGGKALDTGKAVANALNASVIDFASTASMDAPTAAVSVIYDDNGVFSGYEFTLRILDTVMVDSQIVLRKRLYVYLLACDGLATLVEG